MGLSSDLTLQASTSEAGISIQHSEPSGGALKPPGTSGAFSDMMLLGSGFQFLVLWCLVNTWL
jgi:hypothetical protein